MPDGEFLIGRLLHLRKLNLGDDLVGFERSLEQAFEKIIGRNSALVGDDGCAKAEGRRPG